MIWSSGQVSHFSRFSDLPTIGWLGLLGYDVWNIVISWCFCFEWSLWKYIEHTCVNAFALWNVLKNMKLLIVFAIGNPPNAPLLRLCRQPCRWYQASGNEDVYIDIRAKQKPERTKEARGRVNKTSKRLLKTSGWVLSSNTCQRLKTKEYRREEHTFTL